MMEGIHAVAFERRDVLPDPVIAQVFVGNGLLIDRPGAVKQRDDAMVKYI